MTKETYRDCLNTPKKLTLCKRGYCSAKEQFDVYPSAYANAYAVKVCKGEIDDYETIKKPNKHYMSKLQKKRKPHNSNELKRWFDETWVNVCEKGPIGGYKECGTGEGIDNPNKYPYCRPLYKLPNTPVKSVNELSSKKLKEMCKLKRDTLTIVDKKPSRVYLNKKGGSYTVKIPENVKKQALLGITMMDDGYSGGTQTGWNRAKQLAYNTNIDIESLADMRTWFARHGPDAKNGGTSYVGYCKWINSGKPMYNKNNLRAVVSWLIWGGDAAYLWLKTPKITNLLKKHFPNRKQSIQIDNLFC
jgi:hypothetical protein